MNKWFLVEDDYHTKIAINAKSYRQAKKIFFDKTQIKAVKASRLKKDTIYQIKFIYKCV